MVRACALPLLSLAACAGGAAAVGEAKPLITVDLVYGTYDLFYDMYAAAYDKANVDGIIAKLPLDDMKNKVSQQMAQLPQEAQQFITEAQTRSVQIKALVAENIEKAHGPANDMAVNAITSLESHVPALTGLIPKTLGDLVLFTCYISFVVYYVLKVALFVLSVLKCLLCCFCCCSLCRRRGADAAKNGKAKAASNGKAKVVANGTAATGTASGKAKAKAKK